MSPHDDTQGNRCLGAAGREPEAVEGAWQGGGAAGDSQPTWPGPATQSRVPLPAWIRASAKQPAAGAVAWGIGLFLGGGLLSYVALMVGLNELVTYDPYLDPDGGESLLVPVWIGGLISLAGVITLCVGVTRLVAKADVAAAQRR